MTAVPKSPPPGNKKRLAYIRTLPCIVCGAPPPSEATHLRIGHVAGFGQKPPDQLTVPQCRKCHDEEGRRGPPLVWRERLERDPILAARAMHALARSL